MQASTGRKISIVVLAFFAIGVSGYAISYLFVEHGFLQSKGSITESELWQVFFHMHFMGGAVALLTGWIQFWRNFRNKRMGLHRTLGKIYVVAVLFVGGLGGLAIAPVSNGGFPNQLGFGSMAVLWLLTTAMAYIRIRQGNFESHKAWMIRRYAMTLCAVTLRLWLPIFVFGLGLPFEESYATVAWFCWVPNLLVAQYLIDRNFVKM